MPLKNITPSDDTIKPFDPAEFPLARQHGSAGRTEIRETTHRVMGSRQSQKKVERTDQRRQPKTGGTGNKFRKSTGKE